MNSSRSQASTDFIPLLNNHDRLIWGFQQLDAWKTLVWLKFICNKQIKQTLSAGCQLRSPLLSAPLATLEQLRNPCTNTNRKVHPFYNDWEILASTPTEKCTHFIMMAQTTELKVCIINLVDHVSINWRPNGTQAWFISQWKGALNMQFIQKLHFLLKYSVGYT